MADAPLVELRDVELKRASFTLCIPEWRVPPGCVVGVVGPNGAGKTTLLELIGGFHAPDTGSVRVFGLDPIESPDVVFARMGYANDSMPVLSARIDKTLQVLSGYYETWDAELARELVERFRLPLTESTHALSKGQATCLRLLFAMCFRPQLLVLDEPGTGLDLGSRQRLLSTVLDVIQDPARSVIVSSHQLHDVQRISDELLVLNEGRIVKQGSLGDLIPETESLEDAMIAWGAQG